MESVLAISRGGDIALTVFLFAVGLLLIIKGGDWFVDSASRIAEISGIPSFIIGATVVDSARTYYFGNCRGTGKYRYCDRKRGRKRKR